MTQPPTAVIREARPEGDRWLVADAPVRRWLTPEADDLLTACLSTAIESLRALPGGLLVGLLPYPRGPHAEFRAERTPAHLMLFDGYAARSDLPRVDTPGFRLAAPFGPDMPRESYLAAVTRVQAYLASGDAYQVNLAQRFSARYGGAPWAAFARIAGSLAPPHAVWLDLGDRALMSFSPESFLTLDRGVVETRPIKGTRARGATPEQDQALAADLANHAKDRAENLMIVDLLRNDLGKVCQTGTISVPRIFEIESHPNVHHLVSRVRGTLASGHGVDDLLRACFPGGSITGAPKRRAMEIIDELESVPRDVYCGTVFWMTSDESLRSNILIRTFLAHEGVLHGWAGAGIVADSDSALEWQECMDKLQIFMDLFDK